MNADKIKELLDKIPVSLILVAWLMWVGYDYYGFTTDPGSPLNTRRASIDTERKEVEKLKTRVAEAKEFERKLETKKAELLQLARDLESTRSTLSDSLDVPAFMTTVYTEAKKSGLNVIGLTPAGGADKEYYAETNFDLAFKGVFVQLVNFLDRISSLQKIVRVDNFSAKPINANSSSARFVELEGTVQLKVYRYIHSEADKKGTGQPGTPNAPGTPNSKDGKPVAAKPAGAGA